LQQTAALGGTPQSTITATLLLPKETIIVAANTPVIAPLIPISDLIINAPLEGEHLRVGPITIIGSGPSGRMIEVLNGDQVLGTIKVRNSMWELNIVADKPSAMSLIVRLQGSELIERRPVRITIGEPIQDDTCSTILKPNCDAWVTRNGGLSLRMRAQPGTDQAIVVLLPVGTQVKLLDPPRSVGTAAWWRVQTIGGREGWVAGENLVTKPD